MHKAPYFRFVGRLDALTAELRRRARLADTLMLPALCLLLSVAACDRQAPTAPAAPVEAAPPVSVL